MKTATVLTFMPIIHYCTVNNVHQAKTNCPKNQAVINEDTSKYAQNNFRQPKVMKLVKSKLPGIHKRQTVKNQHDRSN